MGIPKPILSHVDLASKKETLVFKRPSFRKTAGNKDKIKHQSRSQIDLSIRGPFVRGQLRLRNQNERGRPNGRIKSMGQGRGEEKGPQRMDFFSHPSTGRVFFVLSLDPIRQFWDLIFSVFVTSAHFFPPLQSVPHCLLL